MATVATGVVVVETVDVCVLKTVNVLDTEDGVTCNYCQRVSITEAQEPDLYCAGACGSNSCSPS
jgi:hypothetical protein